MTARAFISPFGQGFGFAEVRSGDRLDVRAEEQRLVEGWSARARARFLMGRTAARLAFAQLGVEVGPITRGPNREPIWPAGFCGSITHAGGRAIAAVAGRDLTSGIGIDLEDADRWFPDLLPYVAFGQELHWLENLAADERKRLTVVVFSAKESIYKAVYPRVGRYFGFESARVAPGTDHSRLVGRLEAPIRDCCPELETLDIRVEWFESLVLTSTALPVRSEDGAETARR